MAEFCRQCHEALGLPPVEIYDLEGLITEADFNAGKVVAALCEGCGHTFINHKGECVDPQCPIHGDSNA